MLFEWNLEDTELIDHTWVRFFQQNKQEKKIKDDSLETS